VTRRYKALLPQQMKSPRFTFYLVTAWYYKQINISEKYKYYSTTKKNDKLVTNQNYHLYELSALVPGTSLGRVSSIKKIRQVMGRHDLRWPLCSFGGALSCSGPKAAVRFF
jgi:hypothetical protein